MSETIHYTIVPKDLGAHLFEVTVQVAKPDPEGQVFRMPAWIPGSYLIRDFARNVVSARATCDGMPTGVTKVDKSTWQTDPCLGPLTLVIEVYALDLSVRGAHLDTTHAYFNGPVVFPAVVGHEARPCSLDIQQPVDGRGAQWRVATSMTRAGAERFGYGTYAASDYWELIDHPVEIGDLVIGEFDVNGIEHAIAIRGESRVDMARICRDLTDICEEHYSLLGAPKGLDRYLFLLTVVGKGYGGLEHRWSTSLISSRDDLPLKDDASVSDSYRKFLGLCSHEYFHLWNVTRMKPAGFTPYELDSESYTGLLWVFEGITSYYDDLALVRAGSVTPESYLELLGQTMTRVQRTAGRLRQSLEESSFEAWTKFYKQDAGSPNFIVSYYAKGSLVALLLDLTIRRRTNGECSLDDVMRECWRRHGDTGVGLPERGLEGIAAEVSSLDLSEFFERYVRGTDELPLADALADCGVQTHFRTAADAQDMGGKPATAGRTEGPWLGSNLIARDGGSVFGPVTAGSPAERAGLSPGDEAISLDGLRLTAANMQARLVRYEPGDVVTLDVFRQDELKRLSVTLGEAPKTTCYLTINDDADANAAARRQAWLGLN